VFKFVQLIEKVSFAEALQRLGYITPTNKPVSRVMPVSVNTLPSVELSLFSRVGEIQLSSR